VVIAGRAVDSASVPTRWLALICFVAVPIVAAVVALYLPWPVDRSDFWPSALVAASIAAVASAALAYWSRRDVWRAVACGIFSGAAAIPAFAVTVLTLIVIYCGDGGCFE